MAAPVDLPVGPGTSAPAVATLTAPRRAAIVLSGRGDVPLVSVPQPRERTGPAVGGAVRPRHPLGRLCGLGELNRTQRGEFGEPSRHRVVRHMAAYLMLLLTSIVAAILFPLGAMAVVTSWVGSRPGQVVGFAILAFLNIHHYFTDGVVWKLRNPAVREDLFGHLHKPALAPAPAPVATAPASRRQRRG